MDDRLRFEQGEIIDLVLLIRRNRRWEDRSRPIRLHAPRRQAAPPPRHAQLEAAVAQERRPPLRHRQRPLSALPRSRTCNIAAAISPIRRTASSRPSSTRRRISRRSCYLKPGQRVLDIGCGWGGLALYLNRVADVDVLGVTLVEGAARAVARAARRGGGRVADRVKFELMRLSRRRPGQFDRIVSIGMFEHLGHALLPDLLPQVPRAARRRRRRAGPHDGPDGQARHDRPVHAQIHLPGRLPAGAVGDRLGERARAADHGRLRGAAAALRLHAARLVRAVQGAAGRDRRPAGRALLPALDLLSRRLDDDVQRRRHDRLPAPVSQTPRRRRRSPAITCSRRRSGCARTGPADPQVQAAGQVAARQSAGCAAATPDRLRPAGIGQKKNHAELDGSRDGPVPAKLAEPA